MHITWNYWGRMVNTTSTLGIRKGGTSNLCKSSVSQTSGLSSLLRRRRSGAMQAYWEGRYWHVRYKYQTIGTWGCGVVKSGRFGNLKKDVTSFLVHSIIAHKLAPILMPRLWYWQIQTKVPQVLSCSKLKIICAQTQSHNHTVTRKQLQRPSGNLGKMEHSWSACLGSFAHSSPHIGKLHDGQQYSPVTGLRKMLVC